MNVVLLSLLIVTTPPAASTDRYPGVTEVFRSDFGELTDRDYDGWPDHWTRRHGPGFPLFNKMTLCEQSPPGGGRSLRIDLDGGGAVAYSPSLPISPLCDYLLEACVKTEGLVHDRVFLSLGAQDEQGRARQTFCSEKVRGPQQWTRLRLGPVSPDVTETGSAVIGLHVEATAKDDLKACVLFGDIWLGRLPRMTLAADTPTQIYTDPKRIAATCTVSGLTQANAKAAFELTDARGSVVIRASKPLDVSADRSGAAVQGATASKEPPLLAGTAQWMPPVPGLGFYRVRATVEGYPSDLLRREITLAVIRPQRTPDRSEFGWSLPRGEHPLALEALGDLLAQAGVGWVKYPLWPDSSQAERQVRQLTVFLEQMSSSGITVVATLGHPPGEILARFDPARVPAAAEIFGKNRDIWYPSIERVMMLVATRVRWWQLGRDEDTSFVGYPDLEVKIAQVKRELDRVGYDLNVGMGWNWQHALPSPLSGKTPWRFVSLTADPPLTARELATYLPTTRRDQVGRWVLLKPLSHREYALEARATDLVERMLAAKLHGAEGIFASDPLSSEHGLMNDDGTPGELFLPWRTAALALAGAEPLESIRLPEGSTNYVFVRDSDAAMVAWNRTPSQETLYLGEDVRLMDLWGREQQPAKTEAGHQLRLGPLPTFVTGLNKAVALWRHGCVLAHDRIPSVFNQRQSNRLEFRNTFDQPVEGSVTLVTPAHWTVRPDRFTFRLKPGETLRQDFELTLPNNADSGPHVLRADFEFTANRAYRFGVYRPLRVGSGDVRIDLSTRLNERGELEVQQWTINEGDKPIDFRCQLFAPGRQRLATQVAGMSRGQDLKVYRFSDGRELIGKTLWLQAQEANGPQVLNYRFRAEQ
jgi:hypothetical protein